MKIKYLLTLIFFLSAVFNVSKVYAQDPPAAGTEVVCKTFEDMQLAEPLVNVSSTNLGVLAAQTEAVGVILAGDNTCDLAVKSVACVESGNVEGCTLRPVGSSNSTLLGITSTTRALATEDVIPVYFAHYFRDQVKNVPIVGAKVYAQDSYTDIFGAELALAVWKVFRNMALGLMSIFLIFIGIMIIMRKKVDPRTVLTLQAALPKVVISMVLIVFSFAIGALFIRFVPAARGMAETIITDVTGSLSVTNTNSPETTFLVSAFAIVGIIGAFAAGPGIAIGLITAFLGPLTAIAWLVILIMVYLKTLLIYVRMLLNTVTAPFQFAMGAIPGNDAMIINWFKKMLAWLISIPAMFFLIEIAQFVQKYALQSSFFGASISGYEGTFVAGIVRSSLQQLFLLLLSPFISMMLLVQALSVPKKIEALIVGEQKRR